MSILETPRVAFRGRITWDPIVTNNWDRFYDETAAGAAFGPGDNAARFRADAIAAVAKGNWNPHGTHRSTFFETTVTTVDLGAGPTTADPLVGAPVAFAGMLVDLEPYGTFSSQLFFDAIAFGIDGGCQVRAPRATRMTDRYINSGRNPGNKFTAGGASVLWQTAFPKHGGLALAVHDSPVLAALARALEDDDVLGLTVRWCAYRTVYYDTPALGPADLPTRKKLLDQLTGDLQRKLEGGGFQPNPARSEIAGTLGLWRRGEPAGVPGNRALLSTGDIGSADARLGARSLTLDLSNSIPETDIALTKHDLGDLAVVAVDAGGAVVATLGILRYADYDRAAYDRAAGLVTIPLDAAGIAAAQAHDLALHDATGKPLLAETALRACPEQPNLYLDQGDAAALQVRVRARGATPASAHRVAMLVPGAAPASAQLAVTDPDGVATFSIEGVTGGCVGYALLVEDPAGGGPFPAPVPGIDPQVTDYAYVRVLPSDADVAGLQPTWDNVYANVLMSWNAIAPCMDNWLRLNDPEQIQRYGALVRRLTAKDAFEGFRYMPVTRDLSAGKRALLYAWLDSAKSPLEGVAAAPAPRSNEARSGAHRRSEG